MKGTGFVISWPRKPCCSTYVLLVVTTTHAMLRSTFYVHHMKLLDPVTMKTLQYGAFVRHIPGIYNSDGEVGP